MASKFSQGIFIPRNPKKIIGKQEIQFRSSWERVVMQFLDQSPNVIQWASESISIPYKNPLSGKTQNYIPDFLVVYQDKKGKQHCEMIEVKPSSQSLMENAKNRQDKAAILVNTAKWASAMSWCKKNGVTFRILSENDIFITGKK